MADLFDHLLVSCPNLGGMFLLHRGVAWKLDNLNSTGLTVRGARLVRAIQPASLVIFDDGIRDVPGQLARIDDVHDAYVDGKFYYAVSTHSNEIVKLDADGNVERRWTFPGEPDAWHINCLTRWNGRLVFSAFADRFGHEAYKEPPLDVGFVQDLESGERPISGLFQPHSLVPDRDRLLLTNSGAFELHEYDAGGNLLRKAKLDGYTRGVARTNHITYVGLSKARNVDVSGLENAVVVALDSDTWKELGRIQLPVNEIYAIEPISRNDAVAIIARLASHATGRLVDAAERGQAAEFRLKERISMEDLVKQTVHQETGKLREAVEAKLGQIEQGMAGHARDLQAANAALAARIAEQATAVATVHQESRKTREDVEARLGQLQQNVTDGVQQALLQVREELSGRSEELRERVEQHQGVLSGIEARLQRQYGLLNTALLRLEQMAGDHATLNAHGNKLDAFGATLNAHGNKLDAVGAMLNAHGNKLDAIDAMLRTELQVLREARERSDLRLAGVKASTSWRLTRPLRWLSVHLLRRPHSET